MKIKVREATYTEKEIEVQFPIYAYHDCGGDTYDAEYFIKRLEDGTNISICKSRSYSQPRASYLLEVEKSGITGTDYCLGLKQYASTAAQFNQALEEFRQELAKI